MKVRQGVTTIFALLLMILLPVVCWAQIYTPDPPTMEIGRVLSALRAGAEAVEDDDIHVYFAAAQRPPDHVVESIRALVKLVDKHSQLSVNLLDHRLEIYVLSFEQYVRAANQINLQLTRLHPAWRFEPAQNTLANFLPMRAFNANVILTWDFNWHIVVHELTHIVVMRGWSEIMAVDHAIVYATEAHIVRTEDYFQFLTEATRRQ